MKTLRCLGLTALLLTALLAGCGKKGPVRPLELPLPAAPSNVSLQQQGESLRLSWEVPTANQNGTPLTDLQGFRLFRLPFVPGQECPDCRDLSVLLTEVDLDYPRGVIRDGSRLTYVDDAVQAETGYRYRIVPFTARDHEGAPSSLSRIVYPAPPAPAGLTAEGLDHLVRLQWEAPVLDASLGEVVGYRLYRHADPARVAASPVNRQPLTEPRFEDFGRENGTPLTYAVSLIVRQQATEVESALSERVTVTPKAGF